MVPSWSSMLVLIWGSMVSGSPPPYPSWPTVPATHSVVCPSDRDCRLQTGVIAGAISWGSFTDHINTTGWRYVTFSAHLKCRLLSPCAPHTLVCSALAVHTSSAESGSQQAYAAGFLEGALMPGVFSLLSILAAMSGDQGVITLLPTLPWSQASSTRTLATSGA